VFSGPCGDIFFGPACICAGPREIFFDSLIVSELGFLFFGPVHLLPGPCLHRVGGGNSIVIGAHIGLDPVHVFLTWHRVGGI